MKFFKDLYEKVSHDFYDSAQVLGDAVLFVDPVGFKHINQTNMFLSGQMPSKVSFVINKILCVYSGDYENDVSLSLQVKNKTYGDFKFLFCFGEVAINPVVLHPNENFYVKVRAKNKTNVTVVLRGDLIRPIQ